MLIDDDVKREDRTIIDISVSILERCHAYYCLMWPNEDGERFFSIFELIGSVSVSGDTAYAQIRDAKKNGVRVDLGNATLMMTMNYVIEALQADSRDESKLAERLLMDASFWCGLMLSGVEVLDVHKSAVAKYIKKMSAMGNDKKRQPNRSIKEIIYKYVAKNGVEKKWNSRSQAAKIIYAKLAIIIKESGFPNISFLLKKSAELSEKTIAGWLSDNSDLDHLFSSPRKTSRKK